MQNMLTATHYYLDELYSSDPNNKKNKNYINDKNETNIDKYNYFSTINSLATKFSSDIKEAILPYENLWDDLAYSEQIGIINDIFIKPDIATFYNERKTQKKSSQKSLRSTSDTTSRTQSSSSVTTDSILSLAQDDYNLSQSFNNNHCKLLLKSPSQDLKKLDLKNNSNYYLNNIHTNVNSNAATTTSASTTMVTIASNDSGNNGKSSSTLIQPNNSALKMETLKSVLSNPYLFYKDLRTKSIYQFDGKNLSTFCKQKTGLKMICDEVCGTFSDEHSVPYSVKTKSQMNLVLFPTEFSSGIGTALNKNKKTEENKTVPSALTLFKYQKVNQELVESIKRKTSNDKTDSMIQMNNKTSITKSKQQQQQQQQVQSNYKFESDLFTTSNNSKYERFYDTNTNLETSNDGENSNTNLIWKFFGNSATTIPDQQLKTETITISNNNLYQDFDNLNISFESNNLKPLSTETSTSLDDDDDEDDRNNEMKESSQLLDNDILRKGFEFLNNW